MTEPTTARTSPTPGAGAEPLEDQLRAALVRIEALEAEVAGHRAALGSPTASGLDAAPASAPTVDGAADHPGSTTLTGDAAGPLDRRRFLNTAAAVVGGVAAGTVAAVAGTPGVAAAADTDPILAGSVNQATTRTVLQTTGDLEYGFGVHEVGLASFGNTPPAIAGHAKDHYRTAVLGLAQGSSNNSFRAEVPGTNSNGLVVDATGPGSTGIIVNALAGHTNAITGPTGIRISATQVPGLVVLGDRPLVVQSATLRNPPPERAIPYDAGTLAVSSNASREQLSLWLCINSGTPGGWRKLAGADTAGAFHVLPATVRAYDSRPGNAPLGVTKGPLGSDQTRTIDAKQGGAVPAGATAALVNLTIVDTSAAGFLALHRNGIPWPGNSTINWSAPNTVLANSAVVALDDQARLAVKCSANSSTHFVIDVVGYYR
ncbi:MAG: hypothetical protein MUF83_15530 [Acidimicrobiales bacterium]|nr:hypothetical protein [Acidimicrobiales bacterium]